MLAHSRTLALNHLRRTLDCEGFPRLQMFLIVSITGAAGFLASYWMLRAGITGMSIRYPCAVGVAYAVFLVLLWLWLRTSAEDYTDVPDFSAFSPSSRCSDSSAGTNGSEGTCDEPAPPSLAFDDAPACATPDGGSGVSDALGAAAEADEFAIPLFVLMFVAALIFSSLFVIYSAPVLFAELLLDGVLAASLYRRLRRLETRHWLETAIRRTAAPFAATALIAAVSGWGMTIYAPEAHSIGDVMTHTRRVG